MMAMDYVGWLEFDIKSTIRDWVEDKNYGLEIVVEDTVEKTYNPAYFFQSMNCSEGILIRKRVNKNFFL